MPQTATVTQYLPLQPTAQVTGRVALVTGGSKGLGKAMARAFAEAGADVIISSRHENELQAALKEILDGTGRKGRYLYSTTAKPGSR